MILWLNFQNQMQLEVVCRKTAEVEIPIQTLPDGTVSNRWYIYFSLVKDLEYVPLDWGSSRKLYALEGDYYLVRISGLNQLQFTRKLEAWNKMLETNKHLYKEIKDWRYELHMHALSLTHSYMNLFQFILETDYAQTEGGR